MSTNKLTPASRHLLSEIAAGRNRIFYMTDRPNGWVHVERAGLAVRDPQDDNAAILTDSGRHYMGLGALGTGHADSGIVRRMTEQVIYDRRVNY